MVRSMGSMRSEDEEMKNILVCELFYHVALDITGPLPETKSGNKYILVVVDHYSKWCETKAVADHGANIIAKFLEDDVICRCGVPKFVLTDNGQQNLMLCVRIMASNINTQNPNGPNAMGWQNI
jgi:hypothetical protein